MAQNNNKISNNIEPIIINNTKINNFLMLNQCCDAYMDLDSQHVLYKICLALDDSKIIQYTKLASQIKHPVSSAKY